MNPKSNEELMNDVLEGVASPEDRERLDAILAKEPEARSRFETLRGVFHALGQMPLESAPPDLHDDLMRALAEEPITINASALDAVAPPTRSSRRGGFLGDLIGALQARPVPALVSTFAVGTLLGVIGFAGLSGGLTGVNDPSLPIGGAMGAAGEPMGDVIDRASVSFDKAGVVLTTRETEEGVMLVADANALTPAEIVIGFDPGLALSSVRWSGPERATLRNAPGEVSIDYEGIVHYELRFKEPPRHTAPVRVSVRSNGTIEERQLSLGPGGTAP